MSTQKRRPWLAVSVGGNIVLALVAGLGWWRALHPGGVHALDHQASPAPDASTPDASPHEGDAARRSADVDEGKPPPPAASTAHGPPPWATDLLGDGGTLRPPASFPGSMRTECDLGEREELAVTVAMRTDGPPRVEILRGADDPAQRACVRRMVVQEYGDERSERYATVLLRGRGSSFTSIGSEPPLFERHLNVPGVDPVDVARSCAQRHEVGCVLRALDGAELEPRDRPLLMWALAQQRDFEGLRAAMVALGPGASHEALAPFQAVLWRVDHDLGPEPLPTSWRLGHGPF